MNALSKLSVTELAPLLDLVQSATAIRRHFELFNWLQDQVQHFIPHEVMIAAWGDFSLGLIRHDVVSPIKGMRTDAFHEKTLQPTLGALFERWDRCARTPYTIHAREGLLRGQLLSPALEREVARLHCGLVHGIKDQRGHHDCLYLFLGHSELGAKPSRDALRYLLPHIDMACRQIGLLPEQHYFLPQGETAFEDADAAMEWGLSDRESEIMHWVGQGKTNLEIGMILDISAFTVKNHLQRIYRKLNVSNRAQAVSKL